MRRNWRILAMCLLLPACVPACEMVLTSPEDYIGPKAPASQPAQEAATQPTTGPAPATGPMATTGPSTLHLTIAGALLMALENNLSLAVDEVNPSIQRTFVEQQRAVFDPDVTAEVAGGKTRTNKRLAATTQRVESKRDTFSAAVGVSEYLPTGTTMELTAESDYGFPSGYTDEISTRAGLSITQSLLRGGGVDFNLARLRQAKLDVLISQYELRGFAESLAAEVETTYWNYALAQRQIEIYADSLSLAQKQLEETQERIRIGKLAPTEEAAAQAEVALRRENLINARSTLATTSLQLLRLLNPPGPGLWQRQITAIHPPAVPPMKLEDVEVYVQLAMRMRPDLNQARLAIQRDDLEIVRTKNGLLPKMDLFASLGKSGYANSFSNSLDDMHGRSYDFAAGLNMEYPPINRDARAQNARALATRDQARQSLANLEQLAQVDVRTAYVEVLRANEQMAATAVTRKYQEETVRAEEEKFRVGKSTSLLVAQAHRDLLQSQIAEVQAIVAYLNALVDLYRLDGSLLERRGIAAPGSHPVQPEAWKK